MQVPLYQNVEYPSIPSTNMAESTSLAQISQINGGLNEMSQLPNATSAADLTAVATAATVAAPTTATAPAIINKIINLNGATVINPEITQLNSIISSSQTSITEVDLFHQNSLTTSLSEQMAGMGFENGAVEVVSQECSPEVEVQPF